MKVEIFTNPERDWFALKVDGELFVDGHCLCNGDWLELVEQKFGAECSETEVSDEELSRILK